MAHRGPIQQFTEVCLYCGENVYANDECLDPPARRERDAARKVKEDAEKPARIDSWWDPW